jgi:two-component sensor histidine kinase
MRADWRRMFQLDSNSLVETDAPIDDWIDKYIPAEDRARVRDAVEEAIRTKSLYQVEHRVLLPDDSIGWVLSRAVPLLGPNDEIVEWFGVASDVTERREVVEKLDASERRLQLLVAELQHRVRNILTVVRSVFGRTVEAGGDLDDIGDHFKGRLDALARTQVVMTASIGGMVDLENMIRDELLSVGAKDGPHLTISGPDVMLPAKVAESLGLAIHELTTNAIKYGALRTSGPTLDIHWHVKTGYGELPILELTWREQGVPAVELKPSRYGFGSELIEEALPYRLGAETRLQFMGGGVCCTISLPLPDPGAAAANERMK